MAPKKRGRPAKPPIDTTPIVIDSDDDLVAASEPVSKKAKRGAELTSGSQSFFAQSPVKKQAKNAQVARSKALAVPVDETCPLANSHRVYIDEAGSIYDASLNQTNSNENNNKFYRIQILESKFDGDFDVWTRWGRVGERGQSKLLNGGSFDAALRQFNQKFKDKSGYGWNDRRGPPKAKKYTFVERSYEPESSEYEDDNELTEAGARRGSKHSIDKVVQSKLAAPVQKLMSLIFNIEYFAEVMAEMNYDIDKLPLGKLSRETLNKGYEQLKALAALLLDNTTTARVEANRPRMIELSDQYYSYIPHAFGRNRPVPILEDEHLKREIGLLDSLGNMRVADEIMNDANAQHGGFNVHQLDRQYAGLGMSEMTPLDHSSTEYKELEAYLNGTRGSSHTIKYDLEDIFRIEREGEFSRFDESSFGKMAADRRLLWHGSRATNFGGILSKGLRIAPPEAPVSGYMFGKGVYLADMSSKSANYCYHDYSGGVGLLLLCEAELGKPMLELTQADYSAAEEALQNGCYTTFGKGYKAPKAWKDAEAVNALLKGTIMPDVTTPPGPSNVEGAFLMYNEYIAYDASQIRMRYLFRVKMSHG